MSTELTTANQTRAAVLANYASASLEEILLSLCGVGKPRLTRLSDGWYCVVEMHVSAAGAEFKVGSDFTCPTPIAAARQCGERVSATLKQYLA